MRVEPTAEDCRWARGSDGGAAPQWLRWFAAVVYSDVECLGYSAVHLGLHVGEGGSSFASFLLLKAFVR